MNDDNIISNIISLCIAVNHRASEIYLRLAKADANEDLKRFWLEDVVLPGLDG